MLKGTLFKSCRLISSEFLIRYRESFPVEFSRPCSYFRSPLLRALKWLLLYDMIEQRSHLKQLQSNSIYVNTASNNWNIKTKVKTRTLSSKPLMCILNGRVSLSRSNTAKYKQYKLSACSRRATSQFCSMAQHWHTFFSRNGNKMQWMLKRLICNNNEQFFLAPSRF